VRAANDDGSAALSQLKDRPVFCSELLRHVVRRSLYDEAASGRKDEHLSLCRLLVGVDFHIRASCSVTAVYSAQSRARFLHYPCSTAVGPSHA
jgi:hypothetical protein